MILQSVEVTDLLLENDRWQQEGNIPLHLAAKSGHLEICELFVEKLHCKNPENKKGNTPFHLAAEFGHLDVCELFLTKLHCKSTENKKGKTPLMLAKEKYPNESGHSAIVELIEDYEGRKKLEMDV